MVSAMGSVRIGALVGAITLAPSPCAAQAAPQIAYATVAQALSTLTAHDGDGSIVTHSEGWTIINEPLASTQWSFTPTGHEAYPAVVRRLIRRGPGNTVAVDTALLCEAPAAACERLRAQFEALNERIVQALRARGRAPAPIPAPMPASSSTP